LNASIASIPISIRDSLSGRAIQIRKKRDGTWSAVLFPNGDQLIEDEYGADDPAAAVMRLARKLQELPQ
jgi:hypothetical protein